MDETLNVSFQNTRYLTRYRAAKSSHDIALWCHKVMFTQEHYESYEQVKKKGVVSKETVVLFGEK